MSSDLVQPSSPKDGADALDGVTSDPAKENPQVDAATLDDDGVLDGPDHVSDDEDDNNNDDEDDHDNDDEDGDSDDANEDEVDAEFDAVFDAAMAQVDEALATAEAELGTVEVDDIEKLLQTLESEIQKETQGIKPADDDTTFGAAMSKLQTIVSLKSELAVHLAPRAPKILPLLKNVPKESPSRSDTISLFCSVLIASTEAQEAMKPNLDALIYFLRDGDALDRHYVLTMLEELAENDATCHDQIKSVLRSQVFIGLDAEPRLSDQEVVCVIETFENIVLYQRTHVTPLFLACRAFDFVLMHTMQPSPPALLAAQSCLTQLYNALDSDEELDKKLVESSSVLGELHDDEFTTKKFLALSLVQLLVPKTKSKSDSSPSKGPCVQDEKVFEAAAEWLNGCLSSDEDIKALVCSDDEVVRALVLSLGRKEKVMYGTSAEWSLARMVDDPPCAQAVRNAFSALLTGTIKAYSLPNGTTMEPDEQSVTAAKLAELDFDGKLKLACGLRQTFDGILKEACKGGLSKFVIGLLQDTKHCEEALKLIASMMENHQKFGYYLLEDDILSRLFPFLTSAVIPASTRSLIPPVLAGLFGSYSPDDDGKDSVSQGPRVATALMVPEVLPSILATLRDPNPSVAGAAAILLGKLIEDELGTQSWGYESDAEDGAPPPPCPRKDKLVTPELVELAMQLLHTAEGAPGALTLLGDCCWGYQRGFELVREFFKKHVRDADAAFFARLYGEYEGRGIGRQRRRVAEAAFLAGAGVRVYALLDEEVKRLETAGPLSEEPEEEKARRRNTIEGFRVVLCADSADLDEARANKNLPKLLLRLLADETILSFNSVQWMMRLLNTDDLEYESETLEKLSGEQIEDEHKRRQKWLLQPQWAVLGEPQVAEHLLNLLKKNPYGSTEKEPDAEAMESEEYEKASVTWRAKNREAKEASETLTNSVIELLDNILPLLGSHVSVLSSLILIRSGQITSNRHMLKILTRMLNTPGFDRSVLVQTAKELWAQDPDVRVSISQLVEWLQSGHRMCDVLREAGVFEWMLEALQVEDCYNVNPVSTLGTIAERTTDRQEKKRLQKAFAENTNAVECCKKLLAGDDEWNALRTLEAIGHLCTEYTEAIPILMDELAVSKLFKLFDDTSYALYYTAPLMGQVVEHIPGAADRLQDVFRSYIAALTTPPPEVADESKGGKKSKKKKKKYAPRMSNAELWDRFSKLSKTTPAARKAIVGSGAIDEAANLFATESSAKWKLPLETLVQLVKADEGYAPEVVKLLPVIAAIYLKEDVGELYDDIIRLTQALLPTDFSAIVSSGLLASLTHCFGEFPNVVGLDTLVELFAKMARLPGGRNAVVSEVFKRLSEDNVEKFESCWGYAGSLWRLVTTEEFAGVGKEPAVLDFVVRLLRHENEIWNTTANAKGAALAARLAISENLPDEARPQILELVEKARANAIECSQKTFTEDLKGEDGEPADEDDFKWQRTRNTRDADEMDTVLAVLRGETNVYVGEDY